MSVSHRQRLLYGGVLVALLSVIIVIYTRLSAPTQPVAISPLLLTPRPASQPSSPLAQQALASIAPLASLSTEITASPTSETWIVATAPPVPEPEITNPPIPTAIPTPVVTPIPTITPPYIEGLVAQPPEPFWAYWAEGDEVWRVDSQGQAAELVVDTFAATGQHLLGVAPEGEGTDCCEPTSYFAVAPDHSKLALVTIDQATIDAGAGLRKFPYGSAVAIHIYDMANGTSLSLGSGTRPVWSPDSSQVAFWREGGLWIANVETGEVSERVRAQHDTETRVTEYVWSPDGSQIAFMYQAGAWKSGTPTLWILTLGDNSQPKMLMRKENVNFGGARWSQDSKSIYYLSFENEGYSSSQYQNLGKVSVEDGTTQPLTTGMMVGSFGFLPGQPWLYLSGIRLNEYAPEENTYYSVWLVNSDDGTLRRLTGGEEDWFAYTHTPEGANLLVIDEHMQPQLLSLVDGSLTAMEAQVGEFYTYGGAKE